MDEVEKSMKEAEATLARLASVLSEGKALLAKSEELAAQGATTEVARAWLEKQPGEMREHAQKEVQGLVEEIERDLPKAEVPRSVRRRPTRQMV